MAQHHHLPKWAVTTLKFTRRAEGIVERHWPFAAYLTLTLAAAGYVLGQFARIV